MRDRRRPATHADRPTLQAHGLAHRRHRLVGPAHRVVGVDRNSRPPRSAPRRAACDAATPSAASPSSSFTIADSTAASHPASAPPASCAPRRRCNGNIAASSTPWRRHAKPEPRESAAARTPGVPTVTHPQPRRDRIPPRDGPRWHLMARDDMNMTRLTRAGDDDAINLPISEFGVPGRIGIARIQAAFNARRRVPAQRARHPGGSPERCHGFSEMQGKDGEKEASEIAGICGAFSGCTGFSADAVHVEGGGTDSPGPCGRAPVGVRGVGTTWPVSGSWSGPRRR